MVYAAVEEVFVPGVTAGARAKPGMKARLVGAAYALGWSAICRLPESWAAAAFRFVADIAWRRQGPAIRVLEGNLRRVLGPAATGKELRAATWPAAAASWCRCRTWATGIRPERG